MINDSNIFRWRWKLVLFNALWRHKLQWRHICKRLIRVRKGCLFHWCIYFEKYCCLMCQGRKLWDDPRKLAKKQTDRWTNSTAAVGVLQVQGTPNSIEHSNNVMLNSHLVDCLLSPESFSFRLHWTLPPSRLLLLKSAMHTCNSGLTHSTLLPHSELCVTVGPVTRTVSILTDPVG